MVIRGGYSMVYDRIGQSLATRFDQVGSFGLSTQLSSPVNANNEDNPDIRFTTLTGIPSTLPAVPPGGFPQTPPVAAGQITSALDSSIKTPYSHTFNIVVGRELGGDYSFEAAYVGRVGRNQLIRRDLMMAADFTDKKSGTDYFTAVKQLIDAAHASGDPLTVAKIPYWENVFPGAAGDPLGFGGNYTATQNMAEWFTENEPDWITALWVADEGCFPSCASTGPFTFFNQQYDSLGAMSSIAHSDYNSLQVSLRKRFSHGYQFDVNYTLAHSQDLGSAVERGSFFTTYGNGGYTGFLINTWNPEQQYGNSDFDIRHQINVNWVAELPFGTGKKFGGDSNGFVNALIGDWQISGLWRWTSGFPFNVQNCRSCWATNWNLQGNASLVTPGVLPALATTKDAVSGQPSPFVDPQAAIDFFRRDYPGESGLRNELRGDGYFTIDTSIAKSFEMPWSKDQKLRFRWDIFNLTNTPTFDVGNVTMLPDRASTFGSYNGSYATCDGGAGRCMQFALRYEF